ncbi:hypothetical protein K437DRAFT_275787 [Tilletiaria anomala UBC 951]|uniref:Uncharacterized protein n=1 Tax=Tilletiaria anomala (strain ATCC 24038 / CBS 436.72 / UBC 951) TaxID=1037660 RepID=A0A066VEI8_TILAU|nr:uncharacterized protein K437DRAFT_275787 [Tilletiaria anomala UBC 951]KDN40167.1 hypothetical protein K437DRAFT_275787 [Tilletiaria anomala UBC 951]
MLSYRFLALLDFTLTASPPAARIVELCHNLYLHSLRDTAASEQALYRPMGHFGSDSPYHAGHTPPLPANNDPRLVAKAKKVSGRDKWAWNSKDQQRVVGSAYCFAEGFFGAPCQAGYNVGSTAEARHVRWNFLPETPTAALGSLVGYRYASRTAHLSCNWRAFHVESQISNGCNVFTPAKQLAWEWSQDINYVTYHDVRRPCLHTRGLKGNLMTYIPLWTQANLDAARLASLNVEIYISSSYHTLADVPMPYHPWRHAFRSGDVVRFACNYIIDSFTCPSISSSNKHYICMHGDQAFYPLEGHGVGTTGTVDGIFWLEGWLQQLAAHQPC